MRLLLVEDEIDIQSFLQRSLEEAGYEVETAPDGKTAERLAVENPFDILIVDLGLARPGRNLPDPSPASIGRKSAGADSVCAQIGG